MPWINHLSDKTPTPMWNARCQMWRITRFLIHQSTSQDWAITRLATLPLGGLRINLDKTMPCLFYICLSAKPTWVKTLAGLQWKHNRRSQLQRTLMMPRCCLLWYKHGLIKMLTHRHLSNGYCLEVTIRLLEARQATSPQLPQALSSPVNASHYTEHPMLLLPHSTHYNADNIFIATDYIG